MAAQATYVIKAEVTGKRVNYPPPKVVRGASEASVSPRSLGVPSVVFTEGPTGRRATVAGTGLDVWEIIATWREVGTNYQRLQAAYHWLTEAQLRSALEYYYVHNPQVIEERLKAEEEWTPEAAWSELPFTRPRF